MNEDLQTPAQRVLVAIAAASSGWLGGMGFLRLVHPWAFETEFRWWALTSGAYAALLMLAIAGWIARTPASSSGRLVAVGLLRFALAATVLPLCLVPFTAGLSVVLLVTGFAYVVAAIAAGIYFWTRLD